MEIPKHDQHGTAYVDDAIPAGDNQDFSARDATFDRQIPAAVWRYALRIIHRLSDSSYKMPYHFVLLLMEEPYQLPFILGWMLTYCMMTHSMQGLQQMPSQELRQSLAWRGPS